MQTMIHHQNPAGNASFGRVAKALDFQEIRSALSSFCKTESGANICHDISPASKREDVERLLDETEEMASLIRSGGDLFPRSVADPLGVLKKISGGSIPEPENIVAILSFFRQMENLLSFMAEEGANYPSLMGICEKLSPMEETMRYFLMAFAGDGQVKNTASSRLMELESRIGSLRRKISSKAETLLKRKDIEDKLQDTYVTIRNGRVALPIKAEYKNIFPGIIHGISSTDKTAFMEPQELVKDNNELRESESEREEEIYRIMREAAQMLRDTGDGIRKNYAIIGRLDSIAAKAHFSLTIGGTRPKFSADGTIRVKELRHPMMVFRKENPRPNDMEMGEAEKTLVISGPNAGGKTVLLKSIGLAVFLCSSGILPTFAEGSSFPFAATIFAMCGDEQSIEEGQSTFSAQMRGIKDAAAVAGPTTWIIIDEILHGTDPAQATVLAEAILAYLAEKGCRSFISTHLPGLKMMAQNNQAMVNAAMGLAETGKPSFRLVKGHPGISNPMGLAEEIGLPQKILEAARKGLSSAEDRYISAIQDLQLKTERMNTEKEKYEKRLRETEELKKNLEYELEKARAGNESFEKEKKRLLKEELGKARDRINSMIQEAKDAELKRKEETAGEIRRIQNELVKEMKSPAAVPLENIKEGDSVWVVPFDREAQLLRMGDDEKVEVLCGGIRMTLTKSDILGIGEAKRTKSAPPRAPHGSLGEATQEIMLLGLTGEEAMEKLEKELDRQMLLGAERVRVVHGKGVLKEKMLAYLKESPYVDSTESALPNQGGDGATIVHLKG